MKQCAIKVFSLLMGCLLVVACGGRVSKEQQRQDDLLMEATSKAKDYDRLLFLADSLEQQGRFSQAKADYWRGYAYDRKKQSDEAAACWQRAIDEAGHSGTDEDMEIYVKAASRLANLYCMTRNFEGALKMGTPVVARLEEAGRDTTSDYVNLLIYIGLAQSTMGQSREVTDNGFFRATQKHRENIDRNHSDEAYKDAIAGLVNIAFYCVRVGRFEDALYYTRHFGELLAEYEQRPDISADYIDRQLGRYDIYKAQALKGLGRQAEADEVFEAFQKTSFSKSSEGRSLAENFLSPSTSIE